jgi:Phage tail lysozyme
VSGAKGGFGVTISLIDAASPKLDALNKRIAAMTAPAERFNRSMKKFGEVSGISRVTEGIRGLGDAGLQAARSLERMVSPMGALTSAASLAGVVELSRRWADAGTSIGKVSYQLNTPVEQLSRLRLAAKLAGASADGLDSGLKSLNDHLRAVAYGRETPQLLNQLGIDAGSRGHVTSVTDALGQLADHLATLKEPGAQQRALDQLGMGDLLPLLKNGRKGLEDYEKQADRTGGVMTQGMSENAKALNTSFVELGGAIDGVVNRIEDKYAPAVKHYVDGLSTWIEKNKKLADSIGEIGAALSLLGGLRLAPWALRLLGLGAVATATTTAGAAVLAEESLYRGTRITPTQSQEQENAILGGSMAQRFPELIVGPSTPPTIGDTIRGWLGGPRANAGPRRPPHISTGEQAERAKEAYDYYISTGRYRPIDAAGMVAEMQLESHFDPRAVSSAGMPGIFQWDTHRRGVFKGLYGHEMDDKNISDDQLFREQLAFSDYEHQHEEAPSYNEMRKETTAGGVAASLNRNYLRSDDYGRGDRPLGDEYMRTLGHVQIDITHRNAPAGVVSTATGTGLVNVSPPKVETSLAGMGGESE